MHFYQIHYVKGKKGRLPPRETGVLFNIQLVWHYYYSIHFGNYQVYAKKSSERLKSAPTEADAQKTQTPLVAKLTLRVLSVTTIPPMEFAFLSNSMAIL